MEKNIIKSLSAITEIEEKKLEAFLKTNDLKTIFNSPETINPSQRQLDKIASLNNLQDIYIPE